MNNLIKNITNMPPRIKEELIGETRKAIREEIEKQVWADVAHYLPFMIDTLVMEKVNEIQGKYSRETKTNTFPKNINKKIVNIAQESADNIGRSLEPILCENYMNCLRTLKYDYDEEDDDRY